MLLFDPPELKDQISQAIQTWTQITKRDIEEFAEEIIDTTKTDFEPAKYEDVTISPETELVLYLPETETTRSLVRNYQEFIDLASELKTAKFYKNSEYRSIKRILVQLYVTPELDRFMYNRISDTDDKIIKQLQQRLIEVNRQMKTLKQKLSEYEKLPRNEANQEERKIVTEQFTATWGEQNRLREAIQGPFQRFFSVQTYTNGQNITCSLTEGLTLYGLLLLNEGRYSEFYPPARGDDLFIEIQFEKTLSDEIIDNLIQAYLFELSSNVGIDLEIMPIPDSDTFDTEEFEDDQDTYYRIRPLLLGKGTTEPLRLYNQAIITNELEIKILFFTKAVEYISQTVVRQAFVETVRAKLLSPNALEPDAQFITELAKLIEEQNFFTKDKEAIKLTIKTCCDATELAKLAPPFIPELRQITASSKRNEREKSLEKLGLCLADTRNFVAHAKANYSPTGNECPSNEIPQFIECIKLATQQVIRWYCSQSEVVRLT